MTTEPRSIYSGPIRRALDRLERQIAEGGGDGTGGVNEVTIGGTSPTDSSELWVDNTPAIFAKVNGVWTPVSGPRGPPGLQGNPGPPGPPSEGDDEVWIGPSPPTEPQIELWFDSDAASSPTGAGLSYVHNQGTPASTWVVPHNLGWYPNITVEDSGGSTVEGEVVHDSVNSLTLTFSGAFSGVAYVS